MKCLHCGNDTDRISNWRGTSEFCSDVCKKAFTEESDKLAMGRLMQPRKASVSVRKAGTPMRDEPGAVAVVEAPEPSRPEPARMDAPPHGEFIIDSPAVLGILQLRTQPPNTPRPAVPVIPDSGLNRWAEDLLELAESLQPAHPRARGPLLYSPGWIMGYTVIPGIDAIPEPSLEFDPAWPASLGLRFAIATEESPAQEISSLSPVFDGPPQSFDSSEPAVELTSSPVHHEPIPAKRPKLDYTREIHHHVGSESPVPVPVVAPPRLRIHLPKPALNTLRPRYGFAPKAEEEKPREQKPLSRPKIEIRTKTAAKPEPKPEPTPKPEIKTTSKPAPVAKTVAPVESQPTKAAKPATPKAETPAVSKRETPRPAVPAADAPEMSGAIAAPSFGVRAEPEEDQSNGRKRKFAIAAIVVLAASLGYYFLRPAQASAGSTLPRSAPPMGAISMGADSWMTEWAGDTSGSARGRQLTIYKPAKGKRNYIYEFSATAEQHAIGWLFRVKDNRNYYCMKLEWNGEGAARKAQIVKFAVINGEEQPHRTVELRQPVDFSKPVRVVMDIRGANFSTMLNGSAADSWIDSQIPEGSVGFSNERNERAVVRTVKVSY